VWQYLLLVTIDSDRLIVLSILSLAQELDPRWSEPARESVCHGNIYRRAEPILVQKVPDTGRLVALRAALRCLCCSVTNHVDRARLVREFMLPECATQGTDTEPTRSIIYMEVLQRVRAGPRAGYQEKDVLIRASLHGRSD
jgi:hypothetical protein